MNDYLETNPEAFELVGVRASDAAVRQPHVYDRMRDELAANLEGWIDAGGALIEDAKLERELYVMRWIMIARNGKLKLVPKDIIKKEIGRSPDRYDAVALCVWEPQILKDDSPEQKAAEQAKATASDLDDDADGVTMDPYEGANFWAGN